MNHPLLRLEPFARALAVALVSFVVASCGSGAVSNPAPTVNDPNRITILPATATLYSGQPTTFVLSGGTGSYIVSSSNQAVVPVVGGVGSSFSVIPGPVTADTEVTLTVRDTGSTPLASAVLTVRPGTVSNNITITPSSTQGGSCAPAICSGGDAQVAVELSQAGQALANRAVRFEVVSGDFRFITSQPGNVETSDLTTTVLTDASGRARARVRVSALATNQTALLRVVDVGSGAFQSTSFTIAQATGASPGFFASPESITFSGPNQDQCASGGSADVYVYGGTPPYSISTVGSPYTVTRNFVSSSGGFFSVVPNGTCVGEPGAPITITDASGRTTSVRVANVPGTKAVPALVVAPATVTLNSCSAVASVSVGGGTGQYIVNPGSGSIYARMAGNTTIVIGRNPGPASTPVSVGVTSGGSSASIVVNLEGSALTACDGAPFNVSTRQVLIEGCNPVTVQLSGGSGVYSATTLTSSLTAQVSGSVLTIRRTPGSLTYNGTNGIVRASDGSSSIDISVAPNNAAAQGPCP